MNHKVIGTTLIVGGVALILVEAYAGAQAATTGVPFEQTTIGTVVTPIEQYLPISLGLTVALAGAFTLFVVPWLMSR